MKIYKFNIRRYFLLLLLFPFFISGSKAYSQENKNEETSEIVMSSEELESLLTKIAERRNEKLKNDKVLQLPTYRQANVMTYQNPNIYADIRSLEYKLDLLLSKANLLPSQGNTTFNLPSQPYGVTPQPSSPGIAKLSNGVREVLKGHEVFFANNSTNINAKDRQIIQELIPTIKENQSHVLVVLKGYASKVGDAFYNNQLSYNRADAIKQLLVNNGVSPGNIMILYHGSDKTVPADEARRVEITLERISQN